MSWDLLSLGRSRWSFDFGSGLLFLFLLLVGRCGVIGIDVFLFSIVCWGCGSRVGWRRDGR
jgi:hypothetical protein